MSHEAYMFTVYSTAAGIFLLIAGSALYLYGKKDQLRPDWPSKCLEVLWSVVVFFLSVIGFGRVVSEIIELIKYIN